MNQVIPEPENLFMGGLILGEKSSFSTALRQSFVNTGTIHIVALSGYNVTIVAEWIMKIFAFFPKNFDFGFTSFAKAVISLSNYASNSSATNIFFLSFLAHKKFS